MALDSLDDPRGRTLFAEMQHLRHENGSYWTGSVHSTTDAGEDESVFWPGEQTTYTAAAVVLAADALSRLEMNAFEKVFLRFPTRFWDEGVYAVRQQGPEGRWWHSWYDLTPLDGTPTMLTFAAGPAARAIRDWDDAQVVESVLAQLRRLYGDHVVAPCDVHVTRWQDDPYARGSYAYMAVGATTADHDDLAAPIGGVLHLAGEATWTDDPATVTAALCSGHRAAQNVLGRQMPIEDVWAPSE
jgi:monoamine oxidase